LLLLFGFNLSTDIDNKNPSSDEIADLLSKKKQDYSPTQPPRSSIVPGFFSHGSSVSVRTFVGPDGVSFYILTLMYIKNIAENIIGGHPKFCRMCVCCLLLV
jgi:hypothetical protein